MRKCILYFLVLTFLFSCSTLKDRTVDKEKEKIKFVDQSVIESKIPGDVIVLPAPKIPEQRPKDTVIVYRGKKGATATTSYDQQGFLAGQLINCPEEHETKRIDVKGRYQLNTKKVESKMNIELANVVGKWMFRTLVPIGFFFAVAFFLRKKWN